MNPDYLRNLLAELYPRPNPWERFAQAANDFGRALGRLSTEGLQVIRFTPAEPCRMCGAWHGHHEGCPMPRWCP